MAKIYTTNNQVRDVEPRNGLNFELDELQNIVGGHIELVYLHDNEIMVVNEEGHLLNLDFNHHATRLSQCMIVGDVLVCRSDQVL